ncbi:MAG: YggS family pyridoxal phosphate-dependent enzyme [bacterium]
MTSEEIKRNYNIVKERVINTALSCGRNPDEITIVAVSKTHPYDIIIDAMSAEVNVFGENYVQEMKEKVELLDSKNITQPEWHYIGHLQTNKVKYIVPFVSLIHSVDSVHLAEEISKQSKKHNRTIDILLQVNTSGEESKSGCEPVETCDIFRAIKDIENINVKGLMTIGSFSDNEFIYRNEFRLLKSMLEQMNEKYPEVNVKHLSMGMTHDFEAAIEEGATIIRVGTAIFGERTYSQ